MCPCVCMISMNEDLTNEAETIHRSDRPNLYVDLLTKSPTSYNILSLYDNIIILV